MRLHQISELCLSDWITLDKILLSLSPSSSQPCSTSSPSSLISTSIDDEKKDAAIDRQVCRHSKPRTEHVTGTIMNKSVCSTSHRLALR